jgi:excisionase family DNA binding protein
MPYRFVTTATVAEACGMGTSTIRQYAREGRLPIAAMTPGGHYRYDLQATKEALKEMGDRLADKRGQGSKERL